MDKIAMLLHLPGTLAHQLEVSHASTVEQVNLPDGGVAVQIDGQLSQLLPPVEVAGITQAQHDATVRAALAAVQETILLARESQELLRALAGPQSQRPEQNTPPLAVMAELIYQHWRNIRGSDGLIFLLLAEDLGLVPALDEDAADDERLLSIEDCAAVAARYNPQHIWQVICGHLFETASWEIIHPAVFCAAARQMIRTLLPVVVRWLRDDSAGTKPSPASRWELRIAQTQLQSARRALDQHNHVLALHLARWAQFNLEQIAAAHDEHEALSEGQDESRGDPENGGETSLL